MELDDQALNEDTDASDGHASIYVWPNWKVFKSVFDH